MKMFEQETYINSLTHQIMSASGQTEARRGDSLTKKLRDFSVKYVKISDADTTRSKELARNYIENQVMMHCRQNSSLPILRLEYTGSVYEGLKTEAADEVDVMVVLKTTNQEVMGEDRGIPGYVRLKASTSSKLRSYSTDEGYIIPERLRNGWFSSLVAKAVNAFNQSSLYSDVDLVVRYHGPAIQIDINRKRTGEKLLSNDLVPCFQLGPESYFVAKSYTGRVSAAELLWRQSFSLKEKAILQHMDPDGGCRHELLRIVKTIVKRERTSLGELESYHLKTAFMHYIKEKPYNWTSQNSLGEHFLGFLGFVQRYLERGHLPHYWLPGINLLEDINPVVVRQMADRIKRILNSEIEMNRVLA